MVAKAFAEIGTTGLNVYYGQVETRYISELYGADGIKVFDEMRLRDPTIRSLLYATKLMARTASWTAVGASDKGVDAEAAEFLESCLDDMSHTVTDAIDDILSMLAFGWFWHEIVYKRRSGDGGKSPSKFDDGRIGWRKWAPRRQTSWYKWEMDEAGGLQGMWQWPQVGVGQPAVLIPIDKSLWYTTEPDCGNPEGVSLLESCYETWYFLKNILPMLGIGFERSFVGLPVFKFLERPTSDDRAAVEAMGKGLRMGEKAFASIPPAVEFALMSAQNAVAGDILAAIQYHRNLMLQSALADFIQLGTGAVGSYALSKDKTELFLMGVNGWLDKIESVLNRFAVPRLFGYNEFPGLEEYPHIEHSAVEKPNLPELAEWLQAIQPLIEFSDDDVAWIRQQSRMPDMVEGYGAKEDRPAIEGAGQEDEAVDETSGSDEVETGQTEEDELAERLERVIADFAERPDEGGFAARVLGALREVKDDLKKALMRRQVVPAETFWESVRAALRRVLLPEIERVATEGAEAAGAELLDAVNVALDWTLVNTDALEFARTHCAELVTGVTDTTKEAIRVEIGNWIEAGEALPELMDRIERTTGFSPERAEMIAITEVTRAYAEGNMIAWQRGGVTKGRKWRTARDERVCPICGSFHNQVALWGEDFVYVDEKGREQVFSCPPAHPRCRCWLAPVQARPGES